MPVIQDAYSINVSNRFDLGPKSDADEGQDSDAYEEIDPLEQLRLLEEQKQREREQKKKQKTQQVNKKSNSSKRNVQFKENKDASLPTKKESTGNGKQEKNTKTKREFSGKASSNVERQYSGDENRRPPRRRNDQRRDKAPRERGGDADQFDKPFDDQTVPRNVPRSSDSEGRLEKRERGGRYERYRGNRGGFRGSFRGGFRNDGRDERGKREFDRRSGSDKSSVRPIDKRDGGGPRNWGTPGNEIEETAEVNLSTEEIGNWADQVDAEQQNEEKQKSDKEDDEKKDVEPEETEEVEPEMTLDEWKALQNTKSTPKPEFKIRQPGEGEDTAKWKNLTLIHESNVKSSDNQIVLEEGHRRQPGKTIVEMDIRFSDMPGMRGKGGRGGGRGGRGGRGGFRGGSRGGGGNRYGNRYNQQLPPDVLNESEFPTLPAA